MPWERLKPIYEKVVIVVSILVLVEVLPWAGEFRQLFSAVQRVSILVLVEVLPWVSTGSFELLAWSMFQSLFWWKYCPGC